MLEFGYPHPYIRVHWATKDSQYSSIINSEETARNFFETLCNRDDVTKVSLHRCQMISEYTE